MTTVHMILRCVGTTSYTTAHYLFSFSCPFPPNEIPWRDREENLTKTRFFHEIHYLSVIMFKVSHGGIFNFQKCHIFIKLYMSILFIKFFSSSLAQTIWERSSPMSLLSSVMTTIRKRVTAACIYLSCDIISSVTVHTHSHFKLQKWSNSKLQNKPELLTSSHLHVTNLSLPGARKICRSWQKHAEKCWQFFELAVQDPRGTFLL